MRQVRGDGAFLFRAEGEPAYYDLFDGEMQNIDGCGYFPDFWVHPDFVMERAVRFIEKQLVSVQADGALGQTSEEEPGGIMRQ